MSIIRKLTKEIVLAPVRVVQGVVDAACETFDAIEGREKRDAAVDGEQPTLRGDR